MPSVRKVSVELSQEVQHKDSTVRVSEADERIRTTEGSVVGDKDLHGQQTETGGLIVTKDHTKYLGLDKWKGSKSPTSEPLSGKRSRRYGPYGREHTWVFCKHCQTSRFILPLRGYNRSDIFQHFCRVFKANLCASLNQVGSRNQCCTMSHGPCIRLAEQYEIDNCSVSNKARVKKLLNLRKK